MCEISCVEWIPRGYEIRGDVWNGGMFEPLSPHSKGL